MDNDKIIKYLIRQRSMVAADIEMTKSQVNKKQSSLDELDKQIEAIKNGLVSVKKVSKNIYNKHRHQTGFENHLAFDLVKAGEQNNRKRTQPLIDAAKFIRAGNQYSHVNGLNQLKEALKTLEENDL